MYGHLSCVPSHDCLVSSFLFGVCTVGPFSPFIHSFLLAYSFPPADHRIPFSLLSFSSFLPTANFYPLLLFSLSVFCLPSSLLLHSSVPFSLPCSSVSAATVCLNALCVFFTTPLFFRCSFSAVSSFIISYFLYLSSLFLPYYFLYLFEPHRICDRVFFRVI